VDPVRLSMSKVSPQAAPVKEPAKPTERRRPSADRESDGIRIHISPRAYLAFYTLIAAPILVAIGVFVGQHKWTNNSTAASQKPTSGLQPVVRTEHTFLNPGPWGTVECVPFELTIPEEFLSVRMDEKSDRRWFFKGYTADSLKTFFQQQPLTDQQRHQLLQSTWEVGADGIRITPPADVVLNLSTEARSSIYNVLAQFAENPWQREDAYAIPAREFEHFFDKIDVSAETIAMVKRMCYPRGKVVMFSDIPTILEKISSPTEKLNLEKALSRRFTMLLKLHIAPGTDVDRLLSYWGRAGQGKDLRPLLQAMSKLPNGAIVDITHLLPPMPTSRLYTYPYPSYTQPENCHWTSFNFFRDPPEGNYADPASIRKKLDSDYYPVFSDPRFGDLVFLTKPNGEIIHSAVYIADNVVYTKNGGHFSAPWLLMEMSRLLDCYATFVGPDEQLKPLYYRNKYY
jgi:hypothetical protein